MSKLKLGILTVTMCMMLGSITASAGSFRFVVVPGGCDVGRWQAVKYDNVQQATVITRTVSGSGRIWAAVYDGSGSQQCTTNVGIEAATINIALPAYYYITAYPNVTYRIIGCDDEYEVTSPSFVATGDWAP